MGRRMYGSSPFRRRRSSTDLAMAAVDVDGKARRAYEDWLEEIDAEPESLAELLASEYGVDLDEIEQEQRFEALMDAMEAEAWVAFGRRRSLH